MHDSACSISLPTQLGLVGSSGCGSDEAGERDLKDAEEGTEEDFREEGNDDEEDDIPLAL